MSDDNITMDLTTCPKCGVGNPDQNSSGEIQCENCGYDETSDEVKEVEYRDD